MKTTHYWLARVKIDPLPEYDKVTIRLHTNKKVTIVLPTACWQTSSVIETKIRPFITAHFVGRVRIKPVFEQYPGGMRFYYLIIQTRED